MGRPSFNVESSVLCWSLKDIMSRKSPFLRTLKKYYSKWLWCLKNWSGNLYFSPSDPWPDCSENPHSYVDLQRNIFRKSALLCLWTNIFKKVHIRNKIHISTLLYMFLKKCCSAPLTYKLFEKYVLFWFLKKNILHKNIALILEKYSTEIPLLKHW